MKKWVKILISVLIVFFVGGGLGFGLTYRIGWAVYDANAVNNGPWRTNLLQGSTAQDIYLRYIISVWAVMALPRQETLYYGTYTTDKGEPLLTKYDYVLEGKNLDTRWWSITVYDNEGWLFPNKLNRYSYNMDTVKFDTDGKYRIFLSRAAKEGNWLPLGDTGRFQLLLRCYNPGSIFYEKPGEVELPHIMKEAGK
jgi:hypothetical protein